MSSECGDKYIKGRGAARNPGNRFESAAYAPLEEPDMPLGEEADAGAGDPSACSGPRTRFYPDATKTIFSRNTSPDIPFEYSINPYRGCEHGCVYCYARPMHEYLGWSAGLDFESRILVKEDAPRLLRAALAKPSWRPQVVAMAGATDVYQPAERRWKLTRACLEVFAEARNPVGIITKNALVLRDVDVLEPLAEHDCIHVMISVTTLDLGLNRKLEPRSSPPRQRLKAIEALAARGVSVGVLIAPVIPALTDEELPAIMGAAADAGARTAGYEILRLPHGIKDLFCDWLDAHMPQRKEKILSRVRDIRGGGLNDPRFGSRMRGEGQFAAQIRAMFEIGARRHGLAAHRPELRTDAFRRPAPPPPRRVAEDGEQMDLFQA